MNDIHKQHVEKLEKDLDSLNEELDVKFKERSQNTKQLKGSEEKDHNMDETLIYKLNKLKKLEN